MKLQLEDLAWSIAEGHTDDYLFEMRYRQFPDNLSTSEYPHRVNIFWIMNEVHENGFPTEAEIIKVHDFEDRLMEAVEVDESAVLSILLTGDAKREFVFYTSDPLDFMDRLTMMPDAAEPNPIKSHCSKDPEWKYYYSQVNDVQGA